jgi:hypothetical protein
MNFISASIGSGFTLHSTNEGVFCYGSSSCAILESRKGDELEGLSSSLTIGSDL